MQPNIKLRQNQRRFEMNKTFMTGLVTLGFMTLAAPAMAEPYVGASATESLERDGQAIQYNAEFMYPVGSNLELRATTDFNREVSVLPTVSLGLGDAGRLYTGAGANLVDQDVNLLLRAGVDWNLSRNLVGITYVDYVEDQFEVSVGLGYNLSGFSESGEVALEDNENTPLNRN